MLHVQNHSFNLVQSDSQDGKKKIGPRAENVETYLGSD
jgi:hypothetical protein